MWIQLTGFYLGDSPPLCPTVAALFSRCLQERDPNRKFINDYVNTVCVFYGIYDAQVYNSLGPSYSSDVISRPNTYVKSSEASTDIMMSEKCWQVWESTATLAALWAFQLNAKISIITFTNNI